jgi:cytochrome P450
MVTAIHDDLFAPEVIADPYTYFGHLREVDPVHWNDTYQAWIITRHDDLVWVARHHELFSSELFKRDSRPPYPPIDEADMELNDYVRTVGSNSFIRHDRPEHTEMRKVLHGYFNPKSMETWRPLVQSAIQYLLDEAEERGEMDVMQDFATPLPLLVIAQMMGMPNQDRLFIRELSKMLLAGGRAESNRMQAAAQGNRELRAYLAPLVEERLVHPTDDLLSVVVSGETNGVYTREEVLANAVLLLVAGHETTINLICNGTLALLRHPEQWALLQQDPARRTQRATEECLRYDSPVKGIQRIAAEDVELRGRTIRAGDRTRWIISSANRDPEMFLEPDTFDITRWPNRHVAFGAGIHHCLGVTLARLEGQEVFKALAERLPSLHLVTEELEYHSTLGFRSLLSLPVAWN